jgi:hypothetical protein
LGNGPYKKQARSQNHWDTSHMDTDVDGIVVVGAILLHISGRRIFEGRASSYEAELLLKIERHLA